MAIPIRKICTSLILAFTLLVTFSSANAGIINIDSEVNVINTFSVNNPIVEFLAAGNYTVDVVGIAGGGTFDAWNAWGFTNCLSGACSSGKGWLNSYKFSSTEFGIVTNGDGLVYATALGALAAAASTGFTLTSAANVSFYIADHPITDNTGGISLLITSTSVPEPTILTLLGLGLAGLGFRRRRKS